ncbi:MAG: hypothetical protein AAF622_15360, partial [Cyanobacteria bacterium P01_C01_bin.147]
MTKFGPTTESPVFTVIHVWSNRQRASTTHLDSRQLFNADGLPTPRLEGITLEAIAIVSTTTAATAFIARASL